MHRLRLDDLACFVRVPEGVVLSWKDGFQLLVGHEVITKLLEAEHGRTGAQAPATKGCADCGGFGYYGLSGTLCETCQGRGVPEESTT